MYNASKVWQLLPHHPEAIRNLAAALRISPIIAQLLLNRGLGEPEKARQFLEVPLTSLHQPQLMPGVAEAAERLLTAVQQGRRICVYGDYDVDGITGTAILWQTLRMVGAQVVDFYVPHRLEEGYGLNSAALKQIAESGSAVVVTVDCGIGSLAEAAEARRLGLELIVTDHHELRETLPDAACLVHPRLPASSYPFGGISGSGVAFKLAWALCQRASGSDKVTPRFKDFLLDCLTLAALGTVADMVPLLDENRLFVRHGLARLRQAPSVGLKALIEVAGLGDKAELIASDIGYRLAPRLNAAGRLGCARLVVDLLTTTMHQRAVDLARFLEEQNKQRQQLERQIFAQARELAEKNGVDGTPALVLANVEWHAGIIGIVAGRLADLYARPVLLITMRRERGESAAVGQGSGRSVPGFPLHEALRACDGHLLSHGGHKAAAGFQIAFEHIDGFRESFCAYAARHFATGVPPARLVIDAEVPLSALTPGLLRDIDRLEPYGSENHQPLLLAGGLQVTGTPRRVGGGERHLQFQVRQQGTALRAIAFGLGDRTEELMSAGGQCCIVFRPRINEWQGRRSVELEVQDFQAGERAQLV